VVDEDQDLPGAGEVEVVYHEYPFYVDPLVVTLDAVSQKDHGGRHLRGVLNDPTHRGAQDQSEAVVPVC
jgi:hypothetical protein